MRKTKWFPMTVKPVRVGWYERIYNIMDTQSTNRDWWDGQQWRYGPHDERCYIQWRAWRGLTSQS